MLGKEDIQQLYDAARSEDSVEGFSVSGEQLYSLLPTLSKMDIFKDVEIEVLESPFFKRQIIKEDGVEFEDGRCVSVMLSNLFVPKKKLQIYSIHFSIGVYKQQMEHLIDGSYMLPPVVSETNFKINRSILTKIELERITEIRKGHTHGEPTIEPEGMLLQPGMTDNYDRRMYDLKMQIMRDFEYKLNKVLGLSLEDFHDPSKSDVSRFGKVMLRVSDSSFELHTDEERKTDVNMYFRVKDAIGALPF